MQLIDNILEKLWKFLCLFSALLVLLFSILLKIKPISGIFEKISNFFRKPARFFDFFSFGEILELLSAYLHKIRIRLDKSAKARRWFFGILIAVLFLFLYPPSIWGPWYHYEHGIASYYGKNFYFNKTSSGERFLPFGRYTAAHKTLPLGITVLVKNPTNGREILVKINDRGPYVKDRRIDLCASAAKKLGIKENGFAEVDIFTRKKFR